MAKIATIADVVERQLCSGCGVCAYMQPNDIRMVDDPIMGRRPLLRTAGQAEPATAEALAACPGVGLAHGPSPEGADEELGREWGPVLEVWEGRATDDDLCFRASSGGVTTALAIHAIQRLGMEGALHIRARADEPLLNETTYDTTSESLLKTVGSRYSPASPCDGLSLVEDATGPSVIIGKPCDIAGTRKAEALRPVLNHKVGLTVAIFCAGTPSPVGTREMLRRMGVSDPRTIQELRYRGHGWPGEATVRTKDLDGSEHESSLTYQESWGEVLQSHRQWRCYVCADHTGEFADISVGDPWDVPPHDSNPGASLIVVRSETGRRALISAIETGSISAKRVDAHRLTATQPWLTKVRGSTGGRIAVLRLLGIPVPRYERMPMWRAWVWNLSPREKMRSTIGTVRRVRRKGLRRRHPVLQPDSDHRAGESGL